MLSQDQVQAAEEETNEPLAAALKAMQDSLPGTLEACLASGALQMALPSQTRAADALALRKATLQARLEELTQVLLQPRWPHARAAASHRCPAAQAGARDWHCQGADRMLI